MDEISRDVLPDATIARASKDRQKGPEELAVLDRSVAAEDLLVSGRPRHRPAGSKAPAGEPAEQGPTEQGPTDQRNDPPAAEPEAISSADAAAATRTGEEQAMLADDEPDPADAAAELPPVPELADPAAIAKVVLLLVLTQREGLTLLRLAQAVNTTQKLIEQALEHVRADLQQLGAAVELVRTGDSLRLMAAAESFPYLQRLRGVKKLERLSPAALETLAVIAYRQPVMRAEIEAIRGVKAGPMLRTLLQHKLVRVTGRADVPGRPLQYGTTQQFLDRFKLSSLNELPSLKEFKQLG
ncbi:MAG TPA: SMC-Scp complex subunit ScpB [Planctomycetota bacterium]|nr:SMC-Scp complex subunit ScpB [Planctomycetota bacterium]